MDANERDRYRADLAREAVKSVLELVVCCGVGYVVGLGFGELLMPLATQWPADEGLTHGAEFVGIYFGVLGYLLSGRTHWPRKPDSEK